MIDDSLTVNRGSSAPARLNMVPAVEFDLEPLAAVLPLT